MMKNEIVTAAKARRKLLLRELKTIDTVIGKLGGTTKRRKYTRRKKAAKRTAKKVETPAAAPAPAKAAKKKAAKRKPAAPKVTAPVYET
jgi:hypothetical protein